MQQIQKIKRVNKNLDFIVLFCLFSSTCDKIDRI